MTMRIMVGDARERLRELPDESVHCVVTSPPYYGLRDYGTAAWDGGDSECDHSGIRRGHGDEKQSSSAGTSRDPVSRDCRRCGARRIDRQIGLEASPAEYVETLVAVFREVRRVLRKDGTLWLNLGDSYASSGERGNNNGVGATGLKRDGRHEASRLISAGKTKTIGMRLPATTTGCKPKDLIGIPWMVAFALRADGWWLRQDLIWSKPNPMPESVTDRCTKAHEYLFLMSRSERYYYDAEAIREPVNPNNAGEMSAPAMDGYRSLAEGYTQRRQQRRVFYEEIKGANKRSVWTVTTQPYTEAHFATFPPALVEPCILAGCPKGGTVLDPFFGAGTTGIVADRLGRDCIGIELNPAYAEMTRARLVDDAGMFAMVEVAA